MACNDTKDICNSNVYNLSFGGISIVSGASTVYDSCLAGYKPTISNFNVIKKTLKANSNLVIFKDEKVNYIYLKVIYSDLINYSSDILFWKSSQFTWNLINVLNLIWDNNSNSWNSYSIDNAALTPVKKFIALDSIDLSFNYTDFQVFNYTNRDHTIELLYI